MNHDISVKVEIGRLLEKIKQLEADVIELRSFMANECPKCNNYIKPIIKSYYDLYKESNITGIKTKYKICPCCNYIYHQYDF